MAYSIHLFPENNFVLIRLSGGVDDAQLRAMLVELNQQTLSMHGVREVVECSAVDRIDGLTVHGTAEMVAAGIDQPRSMAGKLAMVAPPDSVMQGFADGFSARYMHSSRAVKVFVDLQTSLNWLADDPGDAAMLSQHIDSASP